MVPGIDNFGAFLLTALLLNLTPGADTMYILSRSMAQGRRAGIYSALGIGAGIVFHTLMTASGLSIVLARSAALFDLVKYAGAAYLCFLGLKALLARPQPLALRPANENTPFQLVLSGALTNILNPKVALFFLALLPQFIAPPHRQDLQPYLLLGLTFVLTGTGWNVVLACLGAAFFQQSRQHPRLAEWLHKVSGGVFLALGVRVVLPP